MLRQKHQLHNRISQMQVLLRIKKTCQKPTKKSEQATENRRRNKKEERRSKNC